MQKYIIILLIVIISSCASKPEYFHKVYSDTPKNISLPSEGKSLVVLEGPFFRKPIHIDGFNGNEIKGMSRNSINGFEFDPGPNTINVGLFKWVGEFVRDKIYSGVIEFNFKPQTKYLIKYVSEDEGEGKFVLYVYQGGDPVELESFQATKFD